MAIAIRGGLSGTTGSASSFSPSLTTGWTGGAPQSGDLVLIAGWQVGTVSATWSQSGTGTWTFHSNNDLNTGGGGWRSFAAYRVFDGTEGTPTFTSTGTNRIGWVMIALTPDAGSTISIDAWATTLIASTAATSFTPNSATAAGSGEVSVILNGFIASSSGANTMTPVSDSSGWTQEINASFSGSGSSHTYYNDAAYQTGVSGTVTPGAETVQTSSTATIYHVLVKESGGGGTTVNLPVAQVNVSAPAPSPEVQLALPVCQVAASAPFYTSISSNFDDGTTQGWTATTTGSATLTVNATAAHDGADGVDYNIANTTDTAYLSQSITPTPACTVDGWFQVATEGPSGTNIPFCAFFSNGTRIAKAYRQNVTGTASFEYTETDGVTHHFNNSSLVLPVGTWHHVVFTWNINGTFFFAVDDQQLLSTTIPTGVFSAPSIDAVYLGAERSDNPGNWYVDTITVMPAPLAEVSVPLAVAQVSIAAPAPTVTAGGQFVSLTTAQVNVAALAPSPGVTLSLPVAQVTVAALPPSPTASLTLTTARVNVAALAPSPKIQLTLPVAQVSAGALAPSPKVQLGLAVARVVINAPAPTVTAGAGGQIVSLTTAQLTVSGHAPAPRLTLGLPRTQVNVAALVPSPRLSVALTTAQVAIAARPLTAGVGNAPPLGPDTGGSATRPQPGGSASWKPGSGTAAQALPGGSATIPSSGGTVT